MIVSHCFCFLLFFFWVLQMVETMISACLLRDGLSLFSFVGFFDILWRNKDRVGRMRVNCCNKFGYRIVNTQLLPSFSFGFGSILLFSFLFGLFNVTTYFVSYIYFIHLALLYYHPRTRKLKIQFVNKENWSYCFLITIYR